MRKRAHILGLTAFGLLGAVAGSTHAAPTVRVQVDQRGDFVVIGNTLGHECAAGTPAPGMGSTVNCGGAGTNDTAPDIFWRADSPMVGQAEATTMITAAQARSSAVLEIPAGAYVTHAFLYWGARRGMAGADTTAVVEREGVFSTPVTAVDSKSLSILANNYYQSVADVTDLVREHGSGSYRIGDVDVANLVGVNNSNSFAGWWMTVLYDLPTDPPRNLTLLDGLDSVTQATPAAVTLTNFISPMVGIGGKLGVIAYEGDQLLADDSLFFGDNVELVNLENPADNFFNGTRSTDGVPGTNPGDLPWLTGQAQSLSNFDIDVVNVSGKLTAGQKTADIQAISTGDDFFLGGFITSVATQAPILSTTKKTVVDVNGGAVLPGDILEYTIVVTNSGNDTATDVVLTDSIPAGTSYVGGSIKIDMVGKTDLPLDDQAQYSLLNQEVTARLGMGANGANGGSLAVGASTTVVFRVTVNANATGVISNQAVVTASGMLAAVEQTTPTDGDEDTVGPQPTVIVIDECGVDADCPMAEPRCNTAPNPNVCVECLTDAHCPGLEPTCNLMTNECTCVPSGAEVCDNKDNDCNGQVDEGLTGGACMTGLPGVCATGKNMCSMGMQQCTPDVQPGSQPEDCQNNLDDDCDGVVNDGCIDGDNDGIPTVIEEILGTDPNDADSDDDGVPDGDEQQPGQDADGDGLINALDPDSDNDGLFDGTELGLDCSNPATNTAAGNCKADADPTTTTNPYDADTDNGGVNDGSEDSNLNGAVDAGETDPTQGNGGDDKEPANADSDGDGLTDAVETTLGSNPNDADTDDDGVIDGDEPNPSSDTDGDGVINVLDVDSDNDGLYDGTELGLDCGDAATDVTQGHCKPDADNGLTTTSPVDPDSDDGGVSDGSEDANGNGAIDAGETNPTDGSGADDATVTDTDGDGLSDKFEATLGTDPNDADSDDDGVIDGKEPNPADDTDGDGVINALDVDSDNDGLLDGTELGLDCANPATNPEAVPCVPDADGGATKTSPIDPDTDHGGASDGSEDWNLNGAVDGNETNPTKGQDGDDSGVKDSDNDGLSDAIETAIGSNPNDADTDDDGVIDGREPNPTVDTDGDGLINVLDVDSDNDGLYDGTELGLGCDDPATDKAAKHCIPDADGGDTKTSPIDPDTDNGGVRDGSEDANLNGAVDAGETDPTNGNGGDDTDPANADDDMDGLSNAVEGTLGSNPNDADSDDDGILDGDEPNPSDDMDGDGKNNITDEDSDGDGLFDGTEVGSDCSNGATDAAAMHCIPDGDKGATTTNPLDPDTDNGGVKDGDEDANHNGVVDPGERDPNVAADDKGVTTPECTTDSECGATDSGKVCDTATNTCKDGCRGVMGNGCPIGEKCSSANATIGVCEETTVPPPPDDEDDPIVAQGSGLLCSARPGGARDDGSIWLLGLALGAGVAIRRRRHRAQ